MKSLWEKIMGMLSGLFSVSQSDMRKLTARVVALEGSLPSSALVIQRVEALEARPLGGEDATARQAVADLQAQLQEMTAQFAVVKNEIDDLRASIEGGSITLPPINP